MFSVLNTFVNADDVFAVWTAVLHILACVNTERDATTEPAPEKHSRADKL